MCVCVRSFVCACVRVCVHNIKPMLAYEEKVECLLVDSSTTRLETADNSSPNM